MTLVIFALYLALTLACAGAVSLASAYRAWDSATTLAYFNRCESSGVSDCYEHPRAGRACAYGFSDVIQCDRPSLAGAILGALDGAQPTLEHGLTGWHDRNTSPVHAASCDVARPVILDSTPFRRKAALPTPVNRRAWLALARYSIQQGKASNNASTRRGWQSLALDLLDNAPAQDAPSAPPARCSQACA